MDSARHGAGDMDVHVVGFSGTVSEGAAAIKAPVFEVGDRYFSGDPDASPPVTHDRAEIEELQHRGLLSLVSGKHRRQRDHIFLYAHESFLRPSADAQDLMGDRGPLAWDAQLGALCAYMHRDEAVARLTHWAEILLADAKESFKDLRFSRAKESALRARFCVSPEQSEERRRAHLYVAAARLGLGEGIRGVLRNVAVDLSPEEARWVELQASALLSRARERSRLDRRPIRPQSRWILQLAA